MAYNTKEQDFQKRKSHEGSYSRYNKLYQYLMSNYEPAQLRDSAQLANAKDQLYQTGHDYDMQLGKQDPDGLAKDIEQAIKNFVQNDGNHGDTSNRFGKGNDGHFDNIKRSLIDLRW